MPAAALNSRPKKRRPTFKSTSKNTSMERAALEVERRWSKANL